MFAKTIVAKLNPEHTAWLEGVAVIMGEGSAVTVNVLTGPVHPLSVAVTFTVATIELLVTFVTVYAGIFPEPLKPKPTLLELVQAKVAPAGTLTKFMAVPAVPAQKLLEG